MMTSQLRELLGLMYLTSFSADDEEAQCVKHLGFGYRPAHIPVPLMDHAYPRELVAHLLTPDMWARVLNIGVDPEDGHFGVLEGMRIITTPRYIINELDCFRQYATSRDCGIRHGF